MADKHISVKKRNGEVVPFEPEKLIRWAEWAGNIGADWFGIVAETYRKCPDQCTTQDLQNAMIQACAEQEDTPHMLMAGRLLMGSVYKDAFGGHDKIPTVSAMYKRMVEKGLWEDMGYTDDDLKGAESFIDHNRDLHSIHSVVHQITTKYAIKDIEKNIALESPAFVWLRMALGLCKDEASNRMDQVEAYYTDFATGTINAPTPNINNLGTPKRSYASCCVYKSNDGLASLAAGDHIATIMTAASAGIGGMLLTRSKGDGVRKNTIRHGGKLPYYTAQGSVVNANLQGGRGGAETMHINCLDPEIETLLRLRHPTTVASKKIGTLDYSFGYHPLLAQKAARNEQWMLVSYKVNPELWEAMYSADGSFEVLYEEHEKSSKRKKFVSARELALEFLRMQEETGRMYEHNTREMNRHTPFKDKIYSSNLCVAPETRILTDKGYKVISELVGQNVNVWNGQEWSDTTVMKTGENRKLIKVVTKDGYELECTPEHKFYIVGNDRKRTAVQVSAEELKVGNKLIKFDLPVVEGAEELPHAYANGFYTGEGCIVGSTQRLYFYGDKIKLKERCGDIFHNFYDQPVQSRSYGHTRKLAEKFFVPDTAYSVKSRLEWFAGLMDADGTVCVNGETQSYQLCSAEPEFLKEVQLMLQTVGVLAKVTKNTTGGMKPLPANDSTGESKLFMCKTSYRLLMGNSSLNKLQDLGFNPSRLKVTDHRPNRECAQFIKVVAVVDEGRYDDTYCFTEPKRNMGMFNGMLTGQCQEIGLPTDGYLSVTDLYKDGGIEQGEIGLCNLGAIVAGRAKPEQYEHVSYRTLKMVDNVISIMDYPFPHLKYTAQARRSAGIGITNLAYDMAKRGLRYDSTEGKAYMHQLAEMHSFWLHKASVRLAKERGRCEWFHKTKYADGWLPIDTYCKEVDNITSQGLLMDWEGLRKEIDEHGMRHSVLEAYMPVESSSIAGNTTNSIYPIRQYVVVKKSGTNKSVFLAPEMEALKGDYQLAWEVSRKDMTDMYAIFQKFTGQAISSDYYRHFAEGERPRISAKELLSDWLYRVKCGVKSKYYSNTAAGLSLAKEDDGADCESCKL